MAVEIELPIRGSCQCVECQKLTSSVFSTVLVFKTESIEFQGELKAWERTSESGRRNIAYFCPVCGNRIYHFDPAMPTITHLKSGTIDSSEVPKPQVNQWLSRKPLTGFGFRPEG